MELVKLCTQLLLAIERFIWGTSFWEGLILHLKFSISKEYYIYIMFMERLSICQHNLTWQPCYILKWWKTSMCKFPHTSKQGQILMDVWVGGKTSLWERDSLALWFILFMYSLLFNDKKIRCAFQKPKRRQTSFWILIGFEQWQETWYLKNNNRRLKE